LQIIKRFEKEKDYLIPIWQWAETQLEAKPGLTGFPFSSQFLRVAQPSQPSLTSIGTGPAYLAPPMRAAHVRPSEASSGPATLSGFPDPLSTRYRHGTEFISKSYFPPSNPALIFMIWLRFSEKLD
jgi:hypothetical protein